MRKLVLITLVAFVATLTVNPAFSAVKNVFLGTWDYQAPSAPYDYSTGKITFTETNSQPAITIRFTNGDEVKAKEVKIENNTFSFSTEVENNLVKVTGKLAEGKITGKADSPQGLMSLTATRKN